MKGKRHQMRMKKMWSCGFIIRTRASLIVALTCLLCAAYAKQDTLVEATGTVEVVSVDDFENQREETLYQLHEEKTGQRFNLKFNDTDPAIRTGDRIRVRGQHLDNTLAVVALDGGAEFEMVQPALSLAVASGEQRMIVILISFTNAPCTYSPTTVSNWLFRTSGGNSVDGAYRESSLGAMWFTGTVVGPYVINADVNVYDDAKWRTLANAAATADGVNLNAYNRRVYTTDDFKAASWAGLGTIGGEPSWAMIKNANATVIYVHELGHNVGMGHAGTDFNNDGVIENAYGDNSCPMASPYAWREFNAAYKVLMGWRSAPKIIANPTSGTYKLAGVEKAFSTLTEKQLITISVPGSSWGYYLSFKIPVGYDATLGTTYSDKLFIHRLQNNVVGGNSRLIDMMVDNETFSDTNVAFKVTQLSHTPSNVTIRLTYFSDDIATWKTTAGSALWSATSSWTPAVVPDRGAAVIFGTGGSTSVVDTVSRTVGSILFNRAGNFTLNASGGAVLAINDGIIVSNSFIHTINAPLILGNTNTWLVTGAGTLQANGAISGDFPLLKTGPGTLILKGSNTYSGMTWISDGALTANGATALPSTTDLLLGNTTSVGSLTLTNFNQTIASIAAPYSSATGTNIITLAAGRTLAVTDALTLGSRNTTLTNALTLLQVLGEGSTLVAGSGTGTLDIGVEGATIGAQMGTLNLTGLGAFTANYGTLNIGVGSRSAGTLLLATTNTLTANTLTVGHNTANGRTASVYLGQTNTFNIGTLNIGREKTTSALLAFTNLFANPALVLHGAGGPGTRAVLNIANRSTQNGSGDGTCSSTVNFSGGTVNAKLSTLTIAQGQQLTGASAIGTLFFEDGTIDVTTILLGSATGTSGAAATGTFNMTGGNLLVGSGGLIIGAQTHVSVGTGVFTLTGGTATLGSNISCSNGVSTLTLNGGTLNLQGHSIGSATQPIDTRNFQSGTLLNVAAINGTAGLTKTTSGTLTLAGANTYTGATLVSGGTLLVSGSLSTSAVTVASAATLAGTGSMGGSVTVNAGGIFAPGPLAGIGTLTLSNALNLASGSLLQYSLGASNDLSVVGGALTLDGTLNITDAGGFGVGAYTLFTYTGALTNNGLVIGTVPTPGLSYLIDTNTVGQVNLLVIPPGSSVWTNPSPCGNWSNPSSWNPSGLPAAGADVIFGTGGSTGVVDTVSRAVGTLLFNRAASFTLTASGGAELSLNDGITVSNTFPNTIDAPVILGNTNTWFVAGTGAIRVGGVISGDDPLIKTGAGLLTLSATNTFTRGLSLLDGTLNISSDSNLGATNSPNPVTLNGGTLTATKPFTTSVNHPFVIGSSGGTISATSGNSITLSSPNTLTGNGALSIAGTGPMVSVLMINAAQSLAGAININSGRIVINGAAGTLGTGPLTIGTGSASLYLSAAGITLNNATINIQSNGGENRGAIRFASGGTTTGSLVLLANAGLSQEGTSTANLNGNISGGFTLQLNGLSGSGTGSWNLGGSNSVAGLIVAGGTVNLNAPNALGTGALALTVNNGTLNVNSRSVTVGALAGTGGTITDTSAGAGTTLLTVNQSATTTVASALRNGSAKLLALAKSGSGTLTLSGTNTFSGGLVARAGTLNLLNDQSAVTGSVSVGTDNAAAATLNIGSASQTAATGLTISGANAIQVGGTAGGTAVERLNVAGTNGFLTTVTNNGTLLVARASVVTIGTCSIWNQSNSLTVQSVGGYAANMTVNTGGTLAYNGSTAISLIPGSSSTAFLTIAGGTLTTTQGFSYGTPSGSYAGRITLNNGGTLSLSAMIANLTSGSGAFQLGTGGGVIDTAGFSTTLGTAVNNVSGQTGSLTKTGTGTLTLSNANGYTGATIVSNGTLVVNGSLAESVVTVASNATLSGTGTINGAVTIHDGGIFAPGPLSGTGTLTLSNSLTTASGAQLHFALGTSSDLAAVTGALNLGGTLNITNAGGFGVGTYTLFTYTGALNTLGLALGTTPDASLVYTFDTNTTGQVKLVIQYTPFAAWQIQHFGSATLPQAQPNADPDGDRLSNAEEYLAGTNPKLSSSVLAITDMQRSTSNWFSVTWQSVSGKTYRVAYTPSLTSPWLTNLPNSVLTSTGQTTLIYVDQTSNTDTNRFYRINLVP
jgi:autotransporter-associated beta strand protein